MESVAQLKRDAVEKSRKERATALYNIYSGYTEEETGLVIPASYYWAINHTQTFDEKYKEKGLSTPYASFPQIGFVRWLFHMLQNSPRIFVPKSREMLVTWIVIAYIVHHCQIFPRTRAIIQTQSESKVGDLIKGVDTPGYVRTLYERQPEWLQKQFPLSRPADDQQVIRFGWANESIIQGVPKGQDQVRQYHPTIYFCDEAAHVEDFRGSYGAADPVASQIIAVSSAFPSFFFDIVDEAMES